MAEIQQRGLSLTKITVIGVGATLFTLGSLWLTGSTTDAKALHLIGSVMPSVRFFASSAITAAATILALMVAVLSFSQNFSAQLEEAHYQRLKQLGLTVVIVFFAGLLLLSFVTFPLEESGEQLIDWFNVIYYGLIGYMSLLTGAMAAAIWMLYELLLDMIAIATGRSSDLVTRPDEE